MLLITDTDTGEQYYTAQQCAEYLGITRTTWTSYVSRKQVPAPTQYFDARTPLWKVKDIHQWQHTRRSKT